MLHLIYINKDCLRAVFYLLYIKWTSYDEWLAEIDETVEDSDIEVSTDQSRYCCGYHSIDVHLITNLWTKSRGVSGKPVMF